MKIYIFKKIKKLIINFLKVAQLYHEKKIKKKSNF
jgi:hypothetical protein